MKRNCAISIVSATAGAVLLFALLGQTAVGQDRLVVPPAPGSEATVDVPGRFDHEAFDDGPAGNAPIPNANLLQILHGGGLLMYPLMFCSFLLVVFVLERAVALRRGTILPGPFVKRFLHQLREKELTATEALKLCEENGSPVAMVFAGAVRKWGKSSVEVEQGAIDAGERVTNNLRRNLRVLNSISTITPLLGLLGTVFGMIDAFNAIRAQNAMGRPELLAGGISEALLTTAAGLCVAIPAFIAYMYFVGCVDRRIIEIDELSQEVVRLIAFDALPETSNKGSSRRRDQAA